MKGLTLRPGASVAPCNLQGAALARNQSSGGHQHPGWFGTSKDAEATQKGGAGGLGTGGNGLPTPSSTPWGEWKGPAVIRRAGSLPPKQLPRRARVLLREQGTCRGMCWGVRRSLLYRRDRLDKGHPTEELSSGTASSGSP